MPEEYRHDTAAGEFVVTIDGTPAGVAHYRLSGDVADFDHTVVPPAFGGRGVAGRLVAHAMAEVRAAGKWRVAASCPYVEWWLDQHPDYADLRA